MKWCILTLLVVAIFTYKKTLVISDPGFVKTIYPAGDTTVLSNIHNQLRPNHLGLGPQWVWYKSNGNGATGTFQTLFMSDCPHQPADLTISPDDWFTIYFNGEPIVSGGAYPSIYTYKLNLQCGLNNLTVIVMNTGGPGAVIFKVEQEQDNCFNRPAAIYNYKTCTFKCSTNSYCEQGKHWVDYPTCGCECNNPSPQSCNHNTQRYDENTCSCICIANLCPPGLEQDSSSCQCRCKAQSCPTKQVWNYNSCSCVAEACVKTTCTNLRVWEDSSCSCICPTNIICFNNQTFDAASCSCK
jgi:hypothetical protein